MRRFVCVHGHFYQPPRENPWTGEVEREPSAAPWHDWNARITHECYEPNTAARVLDRAGHVVERVNNWAHLSFDVGPTLMSWLERHARPVHDAIVAADAEARRRTGHGAALAHPFGHVILPLASPRDRRTHIRWGLRDFTARFGRPADGFWLPETAVCTDTLEDLAALGVRFTVLAPRQAATVRPLAVARDAAWRDVSGGRIDPDRAYRMRLPSGRTLDVFFYDATLAHGVAFDGLLESGDRFADRILAAFDGDGDGPSIVSLATDGESYGHHHKFGEMALAYTLRRLARTPGVEIGGYAAFLARHPPLDEVRIIERSSWSCVHELGRWNGQGGCDCGGAPGGTLAWRAPLRAALDAVNELLGQAFEREARAFFADPWEARDAAYGAAAAGPPRAQALLAMQRQTLLMFSSCGWFFEDVARLEPIQVLSHAAYALDLARALGLPEADEAEARLAAHLAATPVNDPLFADGTAVWQGPVLNRRRPLTR